jgi:hypothetical protein
MESKAARRARKRDIGVGFGGDKGKMAGWEGGSLSQKGEGWVEGRIECRVEG